MKTTKLTASGALLIAGIGGYYLGQKPQLIGSFTAGGVPETGVPAATPSATSNLQVQGAAPAKPNQGTGSPGSQGGQRSGPTPVEIADVQSQSIQDHITTIGNLLANKLAQIAPETSGRVVTVNSEDGKAVSTGEVLFVLDGELLEAELKDAQSRLALAKAEFKRNETLRKSRNIAQSAFDQSVGELAQAQTAVDLAKVRLGKLTIRAPFSGVLGFRQVSEGAYVTAGMPLVTIAQIDSLKVSASLPELYFPHVKVGGTLLVTADAVPGQTFNATISAIDPEVDVNGRALKIRAQLDNAKLLLRPGMLARIQVVSPERQAVTVSEAAIVPQGDKLAVFTVENDKAKRVPVTTGLRRDGWVEITSGLANGAKVVTAGNMRLADGATVKVIKSARVE